MTQDAAASNRFTLSLHLEAAQALTTEQEHSGLTKTDIANRAIVMYAWLRSQERQGSSVLVKNSEGEYGFVCFL